VVTNIERNLGMGEDLHKVFLILFGIYGYVLNSVLAISMLISFLITILVVLFIEGNDEDIIECLKNNEIPENVLRKYSYVLSFGCILFMILTELIYDILLKN
jgi:hypothetical protein